MADVIISRLTSSNYFRFGSGPVTSSVSSPSMASSCRRCLFGRPADDEQQSDLEQIRGIQQRQSAERWNFDFVSGRPLFGRYDWQRVNAAKSENCARLPPNEDRHDQIGGVQRLELVETSNKSDQSVSTATTIHPPPSLTHASAAAVEIPPPFPVPSCGAGRKRRRNSTRCSAGNLKQQPRHSRRRRNDVRHGARLISTAGAARVTGQCPSSCFFQPVCLIRNDS